MKLYLRLWPYCKKHFGRFSLAFISVLFFTVTRLYFLVLVKELSYDIERGNVGLFIYRICSGIVLILLNALASYGQSYNMSWLGQRVIMKLRVRIYEHLQKLSLDFYSKWKVGEIMSRSTNDLKVVQTVFVANMVELVPETLTFFGVLIYLFILNWKLLLMTFITLPLFAWLIRNFGHTMKRVSKYTQKKMADLSSILQESIYGIAIIKAFAREKGVIEKYTRESERSFWINMKSVRLYAIQSPVLFILQMTMILLIFLVGGLEIINGNLSVGNFLAFVMGLGMLVNPITIFGKVHTRQQQANVALERVFELLDIDPSVSEKKDAVDIGRIDGNVQFKDVSFEYSKKEGEVLKNIDLDVNSGEVIALVGASGSGKTTLVNLIPRFYEVSQGELLIDGQNVKDLSFESLRRQIGIVAQETILFSGTIKDNIAYGKPDAKNDEIFAAAKMANAADFIELFPSKYNTLLGERGVRLSGGQKQRISIARAILSDPRILILDEATSALDTESERLVQNALEKLMKNRTTFVIAHRLSTIINADRIVVLKDGEIRSIGKHDELMKNDPLYKKYHELQFDSQKMKQSVR